MAFWVKTACAVLNTKPQSVIFASKAYTQMFANEVNKGQLKDATSIAGIWNVTGPKRYKGDTTCEAPEELGGDCHKPEPSIPPCEHVKPIKYPECRKICLPCCKPITTPTACNRVVIRTNLCAGTAYKYPAYTETVDTVDCGIYSADCCYSSQCKELNKIGKVRKFKPIKKFQLEKLGLPENTKRYFSTSARLNNDKQSCESGLKKRLACLKDSGRKGPAAKGAAACKECLRVCMPCCKPARSPPICEKPYTKTTCTKVRPPRPSYSECVGEKSETPIPCECHYIALKRCRGGGDDSKEAGKCDK